MRKWLSYKDYNRKLRMQLMSKLVDIDNQPRVMNDKAIFKRLFKYVLPLKNLFIIAIILIIALVGIDTAFPLISSKLMEILGQNDVEVKQLILYIALMTIFIILSILFDYYRNLLLQKAGQRIIYTVRQEVFVKIENLSIAQINSQPIGKYVTRVTNDTAALSDLYTSVIIGILKSVLQIIFAFIYMMITSVKLTLITLCIAPIVLISSYLFRVISRKTYRKVRKNVSNVNAFLSENLSGMKITQSFKQEPKQLKAFNNCNNRLKRSSLQEILVFSLFRPFIYVLYISTVTLVIYFGAKSFLKNGSIGYVTIYAFYLYVEKFFQPIQQIAEQFNTLQSALTASERIFGIIDLVPDIVDDEDAMNLEEFKGSIEFKNVWFAYNPGEWILKDVSFKIEAGQTIAFVGATGSGKTTILSLIVRNYDIQKGSILIDGIDIKKIKLACLRRNIGQMLQDVFLFSGTIKDNITLFTEEIPEKKVEESAHFVNASSFIERLPNKYEEVVKERGNNFSSGERQLLSFARCIAHDPKVMILDEATANIDTETEILIQDSLNKMMNIGTMIIVAHRLSTIQYADNIIVMKKGVIIETGNHQQLLAKGGHYYDLYRLQYQKKEA